MQRSELDEGYSLSNKLTRQEMVEKIPGYRENSIIEVSEPAKYIDYSTGKVKNELITMRDKCPLCGSIDFGFIFTKHGFDHMLCNKCDLIFTLQVLDTNKIKFLFEGNEGDNLGLYKEMPAVNERDRIKFESVLKRIEQYTTVKSIFDFDSSAGTFLDWAKEKYTVIGHEYHNGLRNFARGKGHVVLNDNLENINLDREFDVITCWDYLDHVLKPHEVIRNLSKYLKKGGVFFFAINNRDSLSARMMHQASPIFVGPHHTMHYGINQLKLLMKDGYELLHAESYVSELNWVSNWLNFKNPEFGDTPLMYELLDPKRICELGMGFKVNAFFRKI